MTGFEGVGDFEGTPLERYQAHQAAKGRTPTPARDDVPPDPSPESDKPDPRTLGAQIVDEYAEALRILRDS